MRRGTRAQVVDACVKSSPLWDNVRTLTLTENMRVLRAGPRSDRLRSFCAWQMRIGDGAEENVPAVDDSRSLIKIPPAHCVPSGKIGDLISRIHSFPLSLADMGNAVILAPRNDIVRDVNNILMEHVHTAGGFSSFSVDEAENSTDAVIYTTEFLHSLTPAGMAAHEVVLKISAPYILLRTINPALGLFNGTRFELLHATRRVLRVRISAGPHKDNIAFVPRIVMNNNDEELPFSFKRRQFPIAPAFAMTINKAQGQSLDRVGVYLPTPVFAHGQLYVAISRATSPESLYVATGDGKTPLLDGTTATCTENIVYKEVLEGSGTARHVVERIPQHLRINRGGTGAPPLQGSGASNPCADRGGQQRRGGMAGRVGLPEEPGGGRIWFGRVIHPADRTVEAWLSMCQPGGTFSWLYMPIINAALNRQGGVCSDYDGFDRPQGFQNIVNGYRQLFQQYDVTAANTLNANGYAIDTRQEEVMALDDDLRSRVDAYGQRVAHAIQTADASLLPTRIDELEFEDV